VNNRLTPAIATRASSNHHVNPDQGLPVDVVGVVTADVEGDVVDVVLDVVVVLLVVVPVGLPATAVGCAGVMVKGNDVTTVAVPVLGTDDPAAASRPLTVGQAVFTSLSNEAILTGVVPAMVPLPFVAVPLKPVTVNGNAQFVRAIGEVVFITMLVGRVRLLMAPVDSLKFAVPVAASSNVPVPVTLTPIRVGLVTGLK